MLLNSKDSRLSVALTEPTDLFYGVYIPPETKLAEDNEIVHVYKDKTEALKLVKKYKKARFKVFKSFEQAECFSVIGLENNISSSPLAALEKSSLTIEKASPFKAPKAQDLVQFRKSIEYGDIDTVKRIVLNNPRYLISSGDTPAILQEGSRYNVLHVAAKHRNAEICDFILRTVGDPVFISALYGNDDMASCQTRADILLDLYLNTPDKGLYETPLHFATKFGSVDVTAMLVSYLQCDKNRRNKFGQTPKEIICSRASVFNKEIFKKIENLLYEQFYVPVLRSDDNSLQPIVGEPFCPPQLPVMDGDLISPCIEIHAYAGPMPQNEAKDFRKKWKTPPRSLISQNSTPSKEFIGSPLLNSVSLLDTDKGLERIGRNLAHKVNVGWKEYWPFLGTYTDISTKEGLDLLETYLKNKYLKKGDEEENNDKEILDCGRNAPDKSANETPQKSGSPLPDSPMTDLCAAFNACSLDDNSSSNSFMPKAYLLGKTHYQAYGKCTNCEDELFINALSNPGVSPFLYVEKSCQVFGKRISDYLLLRATGACNFSEEMVSEFIHVEAKHLQSVISSFMDDARFVSVDFHLIHSRISTIVSEKLKNLPQDDLEIILCALSIPSTAIKNPDYISSDEEESSTPPGSLQYRSHKRVIKRPELLIESHAYCLINNIRNSLEQYISDKHDLQSEIKVNSEEECLRVWSDAISCSCQLQFNQFPRLSRQRSSFKRNYSEIYTQDVNRRLSYGGCDFESKFTISSDGHKEKDVQKNKEVGDKGERFYTPPESPVELSEDDEFVDADLAEVVYIEGNIPGKMDISVLHALAGVEILETEYPYIYLWRHCVLLHSEEERQSWQSPAFVRQLRKLQSPCKHKLQNGESPTIGWHNRLLQCSPVRPPRTKLQNFTTRLKLLN